MAKSMRQFARWHIWLGWLAGVPLLLWTLSGLVMVAKPIEEVRGTHLRVAPSEIDTALPPGIVLPPSLDLGRRDIESIRIAAPDGMPVLWATDRDGGVQRFDARTGASLPRLSAREASLIAVRMTNFPRAAQLPPARFFASDAVPLDFRRPMPVWQVTMVDGTHVYVGADTGEIAAVRTRWWRVFDFMWGLHIMDLQTREDSHHPLLIGFTVLALVSTVLGVTLLFRGAGLETHPQFRRPGLDPGQCFSSGVTLAPERGTGKKHHPGSGPGRRI